METTEAVGVGGAVAVTAETVEKARKIADGFRVDFTPSPDTIRRYGKRILAVGGKYSECRGYVMTRFIHFPLTIEAVALADEMMADPNEKPDYKMGKRRVGFYAVVAEGTNDDFRKATGGDIGVYDLRSLSRGVAILAKKYEEGIAAGRILTDAQKAERKATNEREAAMRAYQNAKAALEAAEWELAKMGIDTREAARFGKE